VCSTFPTLLPFPSLSPCPIQCTIAISSFPTDLAHLPPTASFFTAILSTNPLHGFYMVIATTHAQIPPLSELSGIPGYFDAEAGQPSTYASAWQPPPPPSYHPHPTSCHHFSRAAVVRCIPNRPRVLCRARYRLIRRNGKQRGCMIVQVHGGHVFRCQDLASAPCCPICLAGRVSPQVRSFTSHPLNISLSVFFF
jgi:hypothetical protein